MLLILFLMRIILICKRTPGLRSDHTCQKDTRTPPGIFLMVLKFFLFHADKRQVFWGMLLLFVWVFSFMVVVILLNRRRWFCLLRAFGGSMYALDTYFWVGIWRSGEDVVVIFLVAFFSRKGFHETANKIWTSWWTEIVFCLLDFSVFSPFFHFIHSFSSFNFHYYSLQCVPWNLFLRPAGWF